MTYYSIENQINLYDAVDQFKAAISEAGLIPPLHIQAGKRERFAGLNKPSKNTAAWCLLFDDYQGGVFGDFSSGISGTWMANRNKRLTRQEKQQFWAKVQEERKHAEEQREAEYQAVSIKALETFKRLPKANPNHPYLVTKCIPPMYAKQEGNNLVLPMINIKKEIVSLQYISPTGQKWFMKDGRKKGSFIPVNGCVDTAKEIIICEGWSTGVTLAMYHPEACVVAAIDCGNLKKVTLAIRSRWTEPQLIIAGDDDRKTLGNPGRRAALEASQLAQCFVMFPSFPKGSPIALSDFNDVHCYTQEVVA